MFIFIALNIDHKRERGSALVIALIVLAILGVIGVAAMNVADMNIQISSNDRNSKDSFFQADAGSNIGHEYLEKSIEINNATYFNNDAQMWKNASVSAFNATEYSLQFYVSGDEGTYIRSGILGSGAVEGSAMQISAGYEGIGKGAAHGGSYTDFLIRSHREGRQNSRAEVDLGWRHINY